MTPPRRERPAGLVLAGGRSRRFGRDKASAELRGRPLLHWVLERLAPFCGELLVATSPAGKPPPLPATPVPIRVVRDDAPFEGPLGGMIAAFRTVRAERCLVAACDAPFLSPRLLERMIQAEGDVVLARVGGVLQPLPGVYAVAPARAVIEEAFARGERRILGAIASLRLTVLDEEEVRALDPDFGTFVNLNTPAALAEAARHLSATTS